MRWRYVTSRDREGGTGLEILGMMDMGRGVRLGDLDGWACLV